MRCGLEIYEINILSVFYLFSILFQMRVFCVRCRAKRIVINPVLTQMGNGRTAITGICSVCGTQVFKIVG